MRPEILENILNNPDQYLPEQSVNNKRFKRIGNGGSCNVYGIYEIQGGEKPLVMKIDTGLIVLSNENDIPDKYIKSRRQEVRDIKTYFPNGFVRELFYLYSLPEELRNQLNLHRIHENFAVHAVISFQKNMAKIYSNPNILFVHCGYLEGNRKTKDRGADAYERLSLNALRKITV